MTDFLRVPLYVSNPDARKRVHTIATDLPMHNRASQNSLIRRYPNGVLAYDDLADKVVTALVKLEEAQNTQQTTCPCTEEEKRVVAIIFPGKFGEGASNMAASTEKLSADEKSKVKKLVEMKFFGDNPPLRNISYNEGKVEFLKSVSSRPEYLEELNSFFGGGKK